MREYICKNRNILLSGDITSITVGTITDKIFDLTYDDELKSEEFKLFNVKPINLYINSFGGSVYDGLSLVDLIRNNTTPIHTYCFGSAMSMGLWIFLSAKKRIMGRNATLLYHEISGFVWDKLEAIKQDLKELERLQKMYDSIIIENSNILQDKLNDYKHIKSEWYIPAQEALKLGLCHEVL